ncbi:metallophosphoesterase [bacterium]|nr:metallophosphoesterase [bacterium]
MPFFIIIAIGIFTLIYGYVGWRIIIPLHLSFLWNIILWSALVLCIFMPLLAMFLRLSGYKPFWSTIITWIAYVTLGLFTIIFPLLVFRDIALLLGEAVHKIVIFVMHTVKDDPKILVPDNPDRHRFLVNALNMGIIGLTGVLAGYGLYEAKRTPGTKRVAMLVHNLHKDLEKLTIVQITDFHVGETVTRPFVQTIVDEVNKLAPDIIVFTGDLADGTVESLREDVAPLAGLSAPYGVFFVTGNHEYYSGVKAWIQEIRRLGMTVLLNEHRMIRYGNARILLAGVTDYEGGRFFPDHTSSPEAALAGADQSDVKILLAHQPRSIFKAARAGFDILISGHTHGGQYFPWNFFVGLQQPYTHGLHRHENTWIYISRGTGYWGPPFRIGQPSEITVITLTGQEKNGM